MANSRQPAALSKTDSPLRLEAEDFSVQPRIGQVEDDGFRLWNNGQIGDNFEISDPGSYNICVTASGTQVGNYAPNLAVVVDGKSVADFKIPVNLSTLCEEDENPIAVNLIAGSHYLALAYTNDYDESMIYGRTILVDNIELIRKGEFIVAPQKDRIRITETLREITQESKMQIGAAVRAEMLTSNSDYARLVSEEFNFLTSEYNFKPHAIWQGPNHYEFGRADEVAVFAKQHDMKLKGHTLVWDTEDHSQIPDWMKSQTAARAVAISHLRDYIHTVVGHFKGQVAYWDVVNEAISDTNDIRKGYWQQTIGEDYIELAFQFAHEADPNAKLFYNDYGCTILNEKSDAIYELIKRLQMKGVPIHGIGLQSHEFWDKPPNSNDVVRNMQRFADLGLEVHISELDVALPVKPTPVQIASQNDIYRTMIKSCLQVDACQAITIWGITDDNWWYKTVAPNSAHGLLFDEAGLRKSSYKAVATELGQGRN